MDFRPDRKVGLATAKMLKGEGVDPNLVHALGASLGAHVAAAFGYYMGGRISRLTGTKALWTKSQGNR